MIINDDQVSNVPSMKRTHSEKATSFRFELSDNSFFQKYLHFIMGFILMFLMSMTVYKDYKLGIVTDLISQ